MAPFRGRKTAILVALMAGVSAIATPGASQSTSSAQRCEAMVGQQIRPGLAIATARHVPAAPARAAGGPGAPPAPALPGHCRLEGTLDPHRGVDGTEYAIGFALSLPDEWNGRFLLQGGGGLNGSVGQPIGPVASGSRPALARGFAVISHDSGHKGSGFDDSFMRDQRAALNFAEAAVRTVTIAGKALTEQFYGRSIAHSYMTGCSTGGREGMLAAQRYPELFDGIVVGAPAMRPGYSNLGIEYAAVQFNRTAPRDADGLPLAAQALSQGDRDLIKRGLLAQCDALDGLADGYIANVAQCAFDPARLQCRSGKQDGCLSAGQVTAMKASFAGYTDSTGHRPYVPIPYDTGIVFTGPGLPGYLPVGAPGVFGPANRDLAIDIDARVREIEADAVGRLTDTNYWTNLSTFLGRGSKIIFYHGVSDPWFSAFDTWDYWQRAAQANGPAFTDASRLYMVPGMMHCSGGEAFDSFDLLGPVVDWVENARPPERPIASSPRSSASRPLCPHPSYGHYDGGDPDDPASFSCRAPD